MLRPKHVTYEKKIYQQHVSKRMHPKNCCIFPLKFATTLLSDSMKGTVRV